MSLIDRRNFMVLAGGAAASQFLPAYAAPGAAGGAGDGEAETLLASIAEDLLAEFPENASALGLDKDARAGLKARIADRSPAGVRARGASAAARLARLNAIDDSRLSPAARINVGVVRAAHALAVEGHRFPFGDVVTLNQQWSYRNAPYVVAQNTGSFIEIPDFLDSNHTIAPPPMPTPIWRGWRPMRRRWTAKPRGCAMMRGRG